MATNEKNYIFSDVLEIAQNPDKVITRPVKIERPSYQSNNQWMLIKSSMPKKKHNSAKIIVKEPKSSGNSRITRRLPITGWLRGLKEERKKKEEERKKLNEERIRLEEKEKEKAMGLRPLGPHDGAPQTPGSEDTGVASFSEAPLLCRITLDDINNIDDEELKGCEIELDPEELREFQEFKQMRDKFEKQNDLMDKLKKASVALE